MEEQHELLPASCPENIGHGEACKGCPGQALCQMAGAAGPDEDRVVLNTRLAAMKNKFLVLSGRLVGWWVERERER